MLNITSTNKNIIHLLFYNFIIFIFLIFLFTFTDANVELFDNLTYFKLSLLKSAPYLSEDLYYSYIIFTRYFLIFLFRLSNLIVGNSIIALELPSFIFSILTFLFLFNFSVLKLKLKQLPALLIILTLISIPFVYDFNVLLIPATDQLDTLFCFAFTSIVFTLITKKQQNIKALIFLILLISLSISVRFISLPFYIIILTSAFFLYKIPLKYLALIFVSIGAIDIALLPFDYFVTGDYLYTYFGSIGDITPQVKNALQPFPLKKTYTLFVSDRINLSISNIVFYFFLGLNVLIIYKKQFLPNKIRLFYFSSLYCVIIYFCIILIFFLNNKLMIQSKYLLFPITLFYFNSLVALSKLRILPSKFPYALPALFLIILSLYNYSGDNHISDNFRFVLQTSIKKNLQFNAAYYKYAYSIFNYLRTSPLEEVKAPQYHNNFLFLQQKQLESFLKDSNYNLPKNIKTAPLKTKIKTSSKNSCTLQLHYKELKNKSLRRQLKRKYIPSFSEQLIDKYILVFYVPKPLKDICSIPNNDYRLSVLRFNKE